MVRAERCCSRFALPERNDERYWGSSCPYPPPRSDKIFRELQNVRGWHRRLQACSRAGNMVFAIQRLHNFVALVFRYITNAIMP